MIVDWKQIERAWLDSVCAAIVATANANPAERFYAGAFWLLYGDYSSLHVPVFGMNSESSDPEVRWHPPDWRWSIIDDTHERVRTLYQPLLSLQVDAPTFEDLWERHVDVLANVCRQVTKLPRPRPSAFSPGFFVGIIDFSHGDRGVEYLRRSVDAETIVASGILDT